MRACEGCRRRKIKCDAATTNAWPCAACVRLKLHCVPPTVNYDRTHSAPGHISGLESVLDFDNSSHSGDEEYHHQTNASAPLRIQSNISSSIMNPHGPFGHGLNTFHTPPYSESPLGHEDFSYGIAPSLHGSFQGIHPYGTSSEVSLGPVDSVPTWSNDQYSVADLSSVLGELKIEEDGVGTLEITGDADHSFSWKCTILTFRQLLTSPNKRKVLLRPQRWKNSNTVYPQHQLALVLPSGFLPS